jgi:hypothetical protein
MHTCPVVISLEPLAFSCASSTEEVRAAVFSKITRTMQKTEMLFGKMM